MKLSQLNKQLDGISRNFQVVEDVAVMWEDAFKGSKE